MKTHVPSPGAPPSVLSHMLGVEPHILVSRVEAACTLNTTALATEDTTPHRETTTETHCPRDLLIPSPVPATGLCSFLPTQPLPNFPPFATLTFSERPAVWASGVTSELADILQAGLLQRACLSRVTAQGAPSIGPCPDGEVLSDHCAGGWSARFFWQGAPDLPLVIYQSPVGAAPRRWGYDIPPATSTVRNDHQGRSPGPTVTLLVAQWLSVCRVYHGAATSVC